MVDRPGGGQPEQEDRQQHQAQHQDGTERGCFDHAERVDPCNLGALLPPARGVEVIAVDEGPGIADLTLALQDGYSTGNGLGLGLPGTRRISDEFEIRSKPGQGVWVRIAKRVAP